MKFYIGVTDDEWFHFLAQHRSVFIPAEICGVESEKTYTFSL
jgi:hypothetical protein